MNRIAATLVFAVIVLCPALSLAQGWRLYANQEDYFSVNFPGEPEIEKAIYNSEFGAQFPSRVYSVRNSSGFFTVNVVDFRDAQRIHIELMANESEALQYQARNRWINDQRAAMARAATEFRQRGGTVTYDAWAHIDHVEGHQLQISNFDGTRTFVGIFFHAKGRMLYVLEATVSPTSPPPGQFQQSLQFLDEYGNRIRYDFDPEGITTRRPDY
ncbi:MAG: hypothetical protein ACJ0S4_10380 [Candidatus Rariloculaceae bacterium]